LFKSVVAQFILLIACENVYYAPSQINKAAYVNAQNYTEIKIKQPI